MSTPEATGDSRFATRDWDAALADLNAAQGFAPAVAEGEPAQDQPREEPETPQEAASRAEAGRDTPPEDSEATPTPTAEEVRISKKEWETLQAQVRNYGPNLEQQRRAFEQQVELLKQGQGPLVERQIADARREAKREAIRELIGQVEDPAERRQQAATFKAQWDDEDRQVAAERARAEAEQVKTQAGQQVQQAQQVAQAAQAQLVAASMDEFLRGYTPMFARQAGEILGGEVTPEEVTAYVTRPEIVKLAQRAAYQGPAAVNQFGEALAGMLAVHVADRREARAQEAKARRGQVNASGVGREQGGQGAAKPPADLNQFKSTKERPQGDWDAMLKALNEQQGIVVAAR